MTCPFLNRLPTNFVRNYAPALVKQYIKQCPAMSHRGFTSISDPKAQASFPYLKDFELVKHHDEGESDTFVALNQCYLLILHEYINH